MNRDVSLDQQKNTDVRPTVAHVSPVIRWIRYRTLANLLANFYAFGVRATTRRSQELGEFIRQLRTEDRAIQPLADAAGISHSRWRQIEAGDIPPAETLWAMAAALGANASQIERMFELALYEEMFDHLTRIGLSRSPSFPGTAELGITADPTLSGEAKDELLRYLGRIRRSEGEQT